MFRASSATSFLGVTVIAGALAASLGCAGEPAVNASNDQAAGGVTGELSAVSIMNAEGSSSMAYFLRPADGSRQIRLLFDVDPSISSPTLTSGTRLRVWGNPEGDALRVSRQAILESADPDLSGRMSALIGAASTTATVAWVQMDVNGGGVNQTAADGQRLIFAQNPGPLFGTKVGDRSVVQYYDENSYGMLKLTGQVEGPIPFTGTACNNFDPLAMDVAGKVTALGRTYQHYYLFWGSQQNCGPGWGAQGTKNRPGKYVWLNNNGTFCTATGQELGHNFGLMHASTMKCTGATIANDTSTCTSNEYGNPMTVMGGGCRHLISIEKWYSGFFQGCNAVKLKTSGDFTLLPIEIPCNGIQALQIPMSAAAPIRTTTTAQSNGNVTVNFYYLELRGGQGLDTGLKTGVYVHVAPEIPAPTANGPRTFLLDMNPATAAFDPMAVGQTFTDPAGGISFTLNSFDATKASVTVSISGVTGANTCVDGTSLVGAGPDSCGTGPTTGADGGTATGTGGASGQGGATGTGVGGATGTGGRGAGGVGVGGATGAGGKAGTGGASGGGVGGAVVTGTGGSPGAGGSSTGETGVVNGGCSCDVGSSRGQSPTGIALLCAGAALMIARRRKARG